MNNETNLKSLGQFWAYFGGKWPKIYCKKIHWRRVFLLNHNYTLNKLLDACISVKLIFSEFCTSMILTWPLLGSDALEHLTKNTTYTLLNIFSKYPQYKYLFVRCSKASDPRWGHVSIINVQNSININFTVIHALEHLFSVKF